MNRAQRRHLGPEPKTSDMTEIESILVAAISKVEDFHAKVGVPVDVANAMQTIETHCAVSLRVMAKTPPSRIKSETTTFAIGQYMAHKEEMA